jgi:ABC-2 type transport system permease protein
MIAFVLLSIAVAITMIGFGILSGSLSFFIGNASALAEQWRNTLISFSTYPPTLFQGGVKIILYTVIPAGFASYLPVETLRSLSPVYALLTVGGALALLAAGTGAFYLGLRRYESGNLMSMKG